MSASVTSLASFSRALAMKAASPARNHSSISSISAPSRSPWRRTAAPASPPSRSAPARRGTRRGRRRRRPHRPSPRSRPRDRPRNRPRRTMFSRPVDSGVHAGRGVDQRADRAGHLQPPADRLVDPGERPQQRGLAGAVAADEGHPLAAADAEVEVAQRGDDDAVRGVLAQPQRRLGEDALLQRARSRNDRAGIRWSGASARICGMGGVRPRRRCGRGSG